MPKTLEPAEIGRVIAAPNQPYASLDLLAAWLRADPGYAMLTILLYDVASGQGRRIYSSDPAAYPVGDYKPIPRTDWVDRVLIRQENFVAYDVDEFRPHYADWEKLQAMGLLSGTNLPIVVAGEAIGSVNLTAREEGFYTQERVATAARHGWLAAVALLLEARAERGASR